MRSRALGGCLAAGGLLAAMGGLGARRPARPVASTVAARPPSSRATVMARGLPVRFEANAGQFDPRVAFVARAPGAVLRLTDDAATLTLARPGVSIGWRVEGARPARPSGSEALAARSNFFFGRDPSHWRTGVANYARVTYRGVRDGVDLVYHGDGGHLEYDFVVAPGVDPSGLALVVEGASGLSLDPAGNLVIATARGSLVQPPPRVFQRGRGGERVVDAAYRLLDSGRVAFAVASYDHARELVIDPDIAYATYLGGSAGDESTAIGVDAVGNAYLVGKTLSADFPTKNALDPTYHSPDLEIVVTKLNPSGTGLVYSTYIGGMSAGNAETALTFAVDPAGNAYVGGDATADFPVKGPLQTTGSLFVTKLTPDGGLAYSTRFGGSGTDYFNGLKVDAAGYAYLAGATNSTDFPTKNALYPSFQGGTQDGFVAKLAPSGASLVFSTYLGSPGADTAMAAAPDASGRVYVTGGTDSTSFPVKGAPQSTYGGGTSDGFIAAIAADGSTLLYSTYIGGSAFDQGTAIAVDGPGNAYVTGTSTATSLQGPVFNNFPITVGTVYSPLGANNFTAKIHPGGATYAYSALGPGSGDIWIDTAGNAYLPLICGPLVLNPDATSTSQITLDPSGQNCPPDEVMALDTAGNVYFTGYVTDGGIAPTPGAFQGTFAGGSGDAYVIKLGSHPLPEAGAAAPGNDAGGGAGSEAGASDDAGASGHATGLGDAVAPDDGAPPGATVDAGNRGPSANLPDGGTGAGGSGCSVTLPIPRRPWALAPLAALAVLVRRRRA